jgi:poly(hydroxyalkanoate) depolymerase family esterase
LKKENPVNAISKINMQEATRLTREGRLEEAMAVLRGVPISVTPQPGFKGKALASLLEHMPKLNALKRGPATPAPSIPVPDGARFEERTHASAAGARPYKVYTPSGYDGQPLPLVVMLHGCTQSPDDFAAGTRMNELAEAHTFIVVYPAQTQAANMSKCWNWFNARDQQRDGGEPSIIAGVTRDVMREFTVDETRVYVAGLSAGGAAAAIMGATHPDLYAAIGVHSGLMCGAANDLPSALNAMRQGGPAVRNDAGATVPTIVFHGDRDSTVHAINGEQVMAQARAGSAHATHVIHGEEASVSYTQTVEADETGRPLREHWVLHGAGHAWSGGSTQGSYADATGPDASREMVRFFLLQRRAL